MSEQRPSLPRRLGLWTSAGIVIGITIGSGLFRVPSSVAAEVGSTGAIALLWVLGGIITLCLALSLAELSTMFPQAGGTYVYIREAYGPLAAFLCGWTILLINPAAWAGIALIFAEYLGHFVPLGVGARRAVAAGLIAFVTLANYCSVPLAAYVQNLTTATKVLALFGLSAAVFAWGSPADGALRAPLSFAMPGAGSFGVALVSVLFAYEGAASFCALSGEVRDPARTLPRALLLGVGGVIAIYLLVNAAYLYALPLETLMSSPLVATDAMTQVAGPVAASIVAALVMLSTFGSLAAFAIADPRVLFAMARDGLFFNRFAAVHARFETPHRSVLAAGVVAILYVSVRSFEQLAATFILGLWPFYALSALAVVVLRIKRPEIDRPHRTVAYPLVPLIVVTSTVLVFASSLVERPGITLVNLAITLGGIPVYLVWRAATGARQQPRATTL